MMMMMMEACTASLWAFKKFPSPEMTPVGLSSIPSMHIAGIEGQ
jgi:hypothetical protein